MLALLPLSLSSRSASAQAELAGELGLEVRAFLPDREPRTADYGVGLFGRLETNGSLAKLDYKARAFGRTDGFDRGRSLFVVEELWLRASFSPVTVTVGANLLNWSATEGFHPADIINAPNLDSDPERYEKLGEPMVLWEVPVGSGTFSSMLMPYRTLAVLPSHRSRINPIPLELRLGDVRMLDRDGSFDTSRFAIQGAMQLTQSIGGGDFAIHAVHQLDRRQPEVLVDRETGELHFLYRTVTQFGGTWQQVFEPVIAKLEFAYRWFPTPDPDAIVAGAARDRKHLFVAAGLEYGFTHRAAASTFFAEGQAVLLNTEPAHALSEFEHDVLVGYRLSLNDFASSELMVYSIMDVVEPSESLLMLRISRRLGENARLNLAARIVTGGDRPTLKANSDFIRMSLSRFF